MRVGIVCGTTDDPYTNGQVEGAASVAAEEGIQLVTFFLLDVPPRPSWTAPFTDGRELVAAAELDGLLISAQMSHAKSEAEFAEFCHWFAPLPRLLLSVQVPGLPAVIPAVDREMKELMRHLLDDHHYTELAYIGGPPDQQEAERRQKVFVEEVRRRGLEIRPEWMAHGDFRQGSGSEAARQIWSGQGPRPQGIVAANDNMAMGALEYVQSLGLRVPQDFFVTGVDDINVYGLTTVGQSPFLLAQQGMRSLLKMIRGGPIEPLILADATFRRRSSCGCSPTGSPQPASRPLGYSWTDSHSLFELLDRLRTPFLLALDRRDGNGFLKAIAGELASTTATIPLEEWMATLLQLKDDVRVDQGDTASRFLLDAHAMVATVYLEKATTIRIRQELEREMADALTGILAEARTMAQVVDGLARQCPLLGIYSFVLVLAEPKASGFDAMRVVLARGPSGVIAVDPTRQGRPLTTLFPDPSLPALFQGHLHVTAVYGNTGFLGYSLTSGDESHTISRATFRTIVSTAIEQVRLWQGWTTATQELSQSEKMASLGSLVAGVAHEVNTPLGIALTTASDLRSRCDRVQQRFTEGKLARSEFTEFLGRAIEESHLIEQHLTRAGSIVQSFKRVAVDQSNDVLNEFDLRSCLNDVLLSLAYPLKRGGHQVVLHCPEGITMRGFAGSLVQIMTNLVMNSVVHGFEGRRGGTVTVECVQKTGAVDLHYYDDGCGLPPEMERHVFEPYFTTKRGSGGTGLGLNLVKNIVQTVWSGSIEYSPRAGGGVHFALRFPLDTKAEDTNAEHQ